MAKPDSEEVLEGCVGIFLLIAGVGVGVVASGIVAVFLWRWFAVPVFDIREITLPEAIGLDLLISFVTSQAGNQKSDRDMWETVGHAWCIALLKPAIFLSLGYLAHLFI